MKAKKILIVAAIVSVSLALVIDSCVHEIPAPLENIPSDPGGNGNDPDTIAPLKCSADTMYFEQQVLPLVTALCGKSGCHGTINPHEFRLIYSSVQESHSSISNHFSSNTALVHALNEMAEQEVNGYQAPTSEQLAVLQKWISQGKQNNSCSGCDTTLYAFAANVAPLIKYYCSGCHPAPGSSSVPNLSTYAAITTELQNNPGRLIGSIEWTAPYNTSTTKMPQGGNQLSECERTVIRKWIEAGAPNN